MPAKSAAKVIDDESDGEAVARNGATEKGGTAAAIVEETQVVALKVKKERKVFDLPGQTKQLDPKAVCARLHTATNELNAHTGHARY